MVCEHGEGQPLECLEDSVRCQHIPGTPINNTHQYTHSDTYIDAHSPVTWPTAWKPQLPLSTVICKSEGNSIVQRIVFQTNQTSWSLWTRLVQANKCHALNRIANMFFLPFNSQRSPLPSWAATSLQTTSTLWRAPETRRPQCTRWSTRNTSLTRPTGLTRGAASPSSSSYVTHHTP